MSCSLFVLIAVIISANDGGQHPQKSWVFHLQFLDAGAPLKLWQFIYRNFPEQRRWIARPLAKFATLRINQIEHLEQDMLAYALVS